MTSTRVRVAALTSALALAAIALPALSLAPAQPAAADNPCLIGYGPYPNLGSQALQPVDSDVSVYIGGDFTTLAGSAEAEGLIVVGDDATFTTDQFNIGVAGVGSRVSPPSMSDMLVTGGDVTVDTSVDPTSMLDVGFPIGGNVVSGGTVSPLSAVQTNGGTITQSAAPLAPYAATPAFYQALSAEYLALTNTGTVGVADSWQVVFTGDGTSSRQVFTVAGSDLGAAPTSKSMVFLGIPTDAVVVVNVTGTAPVVWANTFFLNNTVTPIDPGADFAIDPTFSHFTQLLMWNFPAATSLLLGDGDQFLGSMMVPNAAATTTLHSSTNGRLYIGGNVVMGGSTQTGLEIHNYAFRFATPCGGVGELSISKLLTDPDSVVDPDRDYTGTYECLDASDAVVASGNWSVDAGGAPHVVSGIPEDAECTVTEDPLTANPSASDDTYAWNAPVYSPASVTIVEDDTSELEVQNSVTHDVGSITIVKALSDPDAVTGNILYTGTYECLDASDAVVASGTWQLSAGGSVVIDAIPSDAECAIDEDPLTTPPSATDSSYQWDAPTYTPATQVVVFDETRTLTVNNSVRRALGELELVKVLDDPFNVVDLARVYTGTFQCTHLGNDITPGAGTWSTTAGAPAVVLATDLPAGTECTATEDPATLAAPPLAGFPQYIWRAPVITPAITIIADGVTSRITVTNIVYDPFGGLAATGSDAAMPLLIAGGALAAGVTVMLVAYRRRVL